MSPITYKILHLLGLTFLLLSLGGSCLLASQGINKEDQKSRKLLGIAHGIGLLLLLVAGFGMLAKLQLPFKGWVIAKLVLWILLAVAPVLIRKKNELAKPVFLAIPILVAAAAYLAIFKPF